MEQTRSVLKSICDVCLGNFPHFCLTSDQFEYMGVRSKFTVTFTIYRMSRTMNSDAHGHSSRRGYDLCSLAVAFITKKSVSISAVVTLLKLFYLTT